MQPKKKIHKNTIWTIVSLILAVLTIRLVIKNGKDISVRELIEIISSSNKLYFILGVVSAAMYVWFEGLLFALFLNLQNIGKAM